MQCHQLAQGHAGSAAHLRAARCPVVVTAQWAPSPHRASVLEPAQQRHHQQQQQAAPRSRTTATAAAAAQPEAAAPGGSEEPERLSSAETARTIVDISSHGTLSTVGDDDVPLGTYVTYVLDNDGSPILRLRADAVHTANLKRNARCSLFVHPAELPARLLGRVTLIGTVSPADEATAADAAARHADAFATAIGIDAPHSGDLFYKLQVDRAFFVGGMGSEAQAESIDGATFLSCEPDELRREAPELVYGLNSDRPDDVLRMSACALGVRVDQIEGAELLWVDTLGCYVCAAADGAGDRIVRLRFPRRVADERDARSALTMMAQVAWESERSYIPVMPSLEPKAAA